MSGSNERKVLASVPHLSHTDSASRVETERYVWARRSLGPLRNVRRRRHPSPETRLRPATLSTLPVVGDSYTGPGTAFGDYSTEVTAPPHRKTLCELMCAK